MGVINRHGNKYFMNVIKNGEMVLSTMTRKLGRFSRLVQAEQFSEPNTEVYIRVNSGKDVDISNEVVDFVNEGSYFTRQDLLLAYKAFLEVAR